MESFLHAFDITYASRTNVEGHNVPFYFLKPLPTLAEQFDIERQIVAIDAGACSNSDEYVTAINSIFDTDFVRSRIDTNRVFLIAREPEDANESKLWQLRFARTAQDAPLLLTFDRDGLEANQWATADELLATITAEFHKKDLFDETQPLAHDEDFFGRQMTIDSLLSAYHQSKNKGIFGLRKTGKTSIFKRLERILEREESPGFVHFVDCQLPAVYTKRWDGLLSYIAERLADMAGRRIARPPDLDPVDRFRTVMREIGRQGRVALIFDEIEWITPWAFGRWRAAEHWQEDYLQFWQSIRSIQQELGTFSIMIGRVIPKVTEVGSIRGLPNPLFNLVDAEYVGSMTREEIGDMVNTLGSKMGLHFEEEAIRYLHKEYGGFPRLTRQACSLIHKMVKDDPYQKFPFQVTREFLSETENYRKDSLSYVSEEILHHLEEFYPVEHNLLRQIATRDIAGAYADLRNADNTHHLRRYGLLNDSSEQAFPEIAISIIEQALQGDGGRLTVPSNLRGSWLADNVGAIDVRFTEFGSIVQSKNAGATAEHMLPDVRSLLVGAQSNVFHTVEVVTDERAWNDFIHTCYQCFIEPFGGYTKAKANMGEAYPEIDRALWRISCYRHKAQHPALKPRVREAYDAFIREDLDGKTRADLGRDYWFTMQQRTVEGLALAVQMEIDRHS